jgi:hypothetical protein
MKSEVKIAAQYNCHKRDKCDNGNKCDKLRFSSTWLYHKSGAMVPGLVGAGVVWRWEGTLASPLVGVPLSLRFVVEPLHLLTSNRLAKMC